MRLTVRLDDDLHRMASAYAAAEGCSISTAINRLLRRLMESRPIERRDHERFPVSTTNGGRAVTTVEVRRLESEDENS
jgi:antitoxin component of RelBE/YafQ-DinJ toxin-antitoxin module